MIALILTVATALALLVPPGPEGVLLAALFSAIAGAGLIFLGTGTFASIAAFTLNVIVGSIVSFALNAVVSAVAGKPKAPKVTPFGIQGSIRTGGDVPRSIMLGRGMTAGSLVWANTWGKVGRTPNAYLTQVIALSDMPIAGLHQLFVNYEAVTLNATADPDGKGFPVDEYTLSGKPYLWVKLYDGTQTTADAFLAQDPPSAERDWEETRVGVGVAYAIVTARFNRDLFTGVPQFRFALDGIPLYDPSQDTSVGGSGAHRYNNPATWVGNARGNAAVILYNLLRGIRYGGEWVMGLQGVSPAQLPAATWIAAINAGKAAGFDAGGEVQYDTELGDTIEALLASTEGRLADNAGTSYSLRVGAPGAAVASISDDTIISTEQQSFTPFPGLASTVNGVVFNYPRPSQSWQVTQAPPIYDATLEAEDGGRRLPVTIDMPMVSDDEQAQRLAKAALTEARRARRHTITLPPEYWALEPGDVIAWTSERNGYNGKLFRVDGIVDMPGLDVLVDITEVDPADYDWDSEVDFAPVVDGFLGPVRPPVQATSVTVEPWTITDGFNARRPAIRLLWTNAPEDVSAIEWQVRIAAGAVPVGDGSAVAAEETSGSTVISAGLVPATGYEVRARWVPGTQRAVAWSAWLSVTTPDTRLTAADLGPAIIDAQNFVQEVRDRLDQIDLLDLTDLLGAPGGVWGRLPDIIAAQDEALAETRRRLDAAQSAVGDVALRLSDVDWRFDGALRDASFEVDPATGRVRIAALDRLRDDTTAQFSAVEATFDAVNAAITLRATQAELNAVAEEILESLTPAARWQWLNTLDGWTATSATATAQPSYLTVATTTGGYIEITGLSIDAAANPQAVLRLRRTAGSAWGVALGWQVSGTWSSLALTQPNTPGDWNTARIAPGWTGTITGLRILLGDDSTFDIDYLEVGKRGVEAQALDDLQARIATAEIAISAAEAAITLKADQATLDGEAVRITSAEARLDAAEGEITLKANSTTVDALETRIGSAEVTISATEGVVTEIRSAARDADGPDAALEAGVSAWLEAERRRESVALARQELTAQTEAGLLAEAAQRLTLAGEVAGNAAALVEERLIRATADEAEAQARLALAAQVADDIDAAAEDVLAVVATIDGASAERTTRLEASMPVDAALGAGVGAWEEAERRRAAVAQAKSELTAQVSDGLTAEAIRRDALRVEMEGFSSALVASEAIARASALSAEAAARTALEARLDGDIDTVTANLTQNYYTAVETDGAISSAVSQSQLVLQSSIDTAQSTADGKGRVIWAASAPTSAADRLAQNLWVKTPENTPHRWNGSAWVASSDTVPSQAAISSITATLQQDYYTATETDGAISSAVSQAQLTLQSSIDGVASTLQQDYYTAAETDGEIGTAIAASRDLLRSELGGGNLVRTGVYADGIGEWSPNASRVSISALPGYTHALQVLEWGSNEGDWRNGSLAAQTLRIEGDFNTTGSGSNVQAGIAYEVVGDATTYLALATMRAANLGWGASVQTVAVPNVAMSRWRPTIRQSEGLAADRIARVARLRIEAVTAAAQAEQLASTKVDAAGAIAAINAQVSAASGGGLATVNELTSAQTTLEGDARALRYLTIDANGRVASQLMGATDNGSVIRYRADRFIVENTVNGNGKAIFTVEDGQVVIDGNLVLKGASVGTTPLATNAVTQSYTGSRTFTGTLFTASFSRAGNMSVVMTAFVTATWPSGQSAVEAGVRLIIDGVTVDERVLKPPAEGMTVTGVLTLVGSRAVPSGNRSAEVEFYAPTGGNPPTAGRLAQAFGTRFVA